MVWLGEAQQRSVLVSLLVATGPILSKLLSAYVYSGDVLSLLEPFAKSPWWHNAVHVLTGAIFSGVTTAAASCMTMNVQ